MQQDTSSGGSEEVVSCSFLEDSTIAGPERDLLSVNYTNGSSKVRALILCFSSFLTDQGDSCGFLSTIARLVGISKL